MSRSAPRIVYDDEGTVGVIDAASKAAGSDPVSVRLEDGEVVQVPADALLAEADGRYRLLVARADLEDLATGETAETMVVPVLAEEIEVGKRKVTSGKVRVKKGFTSREETVAVPLTREVVEIERVPVNRPIEGPVEVRQEGDVTIISVVEEVLVVEKRLILKEEIRIKRRRVEETKTERVTLRAETARIERDAPDGA